MKIARELLAEGVRAVPAVKYAVGLLGIVAAAFIARALTGDYRVAGLGILISVALMMVLVVFSALTQAVKRVFYVPALIILYAMTVLFVATISLIVSSVFFRRPADLRHWLDERAAAPAAAPQVTQELLRAAREGNPQQRVHALKALCGARTFEATRTIEETAAHDPDPRVRETAAELLRRCR